MQLTAGSSLPPCFVITPPLCPVLLAAAELRLKAAAAEQAAAARQVELSAEIGSLQSKLLVAECVAAQVMRIIRL